MSHRSLVWRTSAAVLVVAVSVTLGLLASTTGHSALRPPLVLGHANLTSRTAAHDACAKQATLLGVQLDTPVSLIASYPTNFRDAVAWTFPGMGETIPWGSASAKLCLYSGRFLLSRASGDAAPYMALVLSHHWDGAQKFGTWPTSLPIHLRNQPV
jgi:uncharacterized membrane protein YhhN